MRLKEFIETPEGSRISQAQWARVFGLTGGYLSQLVNEIKVPSLQVALLIEARTDGKVTPYDWGVEVPPKGETVAP